MADDVVRLTTGLGPLVVHKSVYRLWNQFGWPSDDVLADMIKAQKEDESDAQADH